MGRKKRQVIIPGCATIRCPHCSKNFRVELDKDKFLGILECKKCHQIISTPPAYCCVVCAFSKKKCSQSLIMEARIKNLEIRYPETKKDNKPVFLIDEKIINNSI